MYQSFRFIATTLFAAFLVGAVSVANAAIIIVDTTEDSSTTNGNCSLREAVSAANTNMAVDDCAPGSAAVADDIWVFVAGTIAIDFPLPLLERVTLLGGGMDTTTLSGQGFSSVFYVNMPDDSHDVSISNMTIADGFETIPGAGLLVDRAGTVQVEKVRFRDNESVGVGGAIGMRLASGTEGSLRVIQSIFENNIVLGSGGAIGVDGFAPEVAPTLVEIDRTSFIGNYGTGNGGAIYLPNTQAVTIDRSRFHENLLDPPTSSNGQGGAIYWTKTNSGAMTISSSTFTDNAARTGGAISNIGLLTSISNSTFSGNRATSAIGRVLYIRDGTAGIFHSSVIDNGSPTNEIESVLHAGSGGNIQMTHSIVWSEDSSSDPVCRTTDGGSYQSFGYNIDAGTSCSGSGTDYSNVSDPGVFLLGDYGDNTGDLVLQTFLPRPGGLTMDGGKVGPCTGAFGAALVFDQRGETRPVDGNGSGGSAECDIGAVEYQPGLDPVARLLELAVFGNGSGRIVDADGSIFCNTSSSDCDYEFPDGATVTLTATAYSGSEFTGWDEDCFAAGTGSCTLTMDQDFTVSAGFDLAAQPASLTVSKDSSEPGLDAVITSSPSGITCGATCTGNFSVGDAVTLIAAPHPGTLVAGWAGCDSVSGNGLNCTITLAADSLVEAFLENSGDLIFNDGFD